MTRAPARRRRTERQRMQRAVRAVGARRPSRRGRLVLLLLALLVAALPLVRFLRTPPEARAAAAGLRSSAVYVPAGSPVLDAERVRQVVGDRPLVVAVLAGSYRGRALAGCEAVARQQPRNLVLTYRASDPGSYPAICAGSRFPEPDVPEPKSDVLGDRTDVWLFGLSLRAQAASQFRVSRRTVDRTPEVEELVLALDAQVAQDYPDGLPQRVPSPDPETLAGGLLQLAALAVLLVGGFGLLRLLAARAVGSYDAARERRERRAALLADLGPVAAVLVHDRGPADAEQQAEAAELYLRALVALDEADDEPGLSAAADAVRRARGAVPA